MKQEDTCKQQIINHLHRIQGQLKTLEKYVDQDKDCAEIALLTNSIVKSFSSLRIKTLEGILLQDFTKSLQASKSEQLTEILKLYK